MTRREAFARWRRERPFWGALLIALGGIEEFFSGQLDIGELHIQLGLEGLQSLLIPVILVLLAVLIVTMPVHRIFYGVIALVVSIYSLVGVNLGGFVIGMLVATVGGIMVVSWMPRHPKDTESDHGAEPDRNEEPDQRAEPDPGADDERESGVGERRAVPGWARGLRNSGIAGVALTALVIGAPGTQPAQAAEPVKAGCVLLILCSPDPTPTPEPTPQPTSPEPTTPAPSPTSDPADDAEPAPDPTEGATDDPVPSVPAPSPDASVDPGSSLEPAPSAEPDPGVPAPDDPDPADPGDGSGSTIIDVPGQDRPSHPKPGEDPVTEPDSPSDLTTGTPLLALGADNDHGVFTLPSANTSGGSLKITGLTQAGIVTVPLADGTRATTIRIECDELVIDGFQLDTRNRPEVVDLDTGGMTLKGHVVVWIDRVGALFDDAGGLEQSLTSDPLALEPLMTLLGQGHLVLGLVGAQADELSYASFTQRAWTQ